MLLSPHEQEKPLLHLAAHLASEHRERGVATQLSRGHRDDQLLGAGGCA
jgi:urease gamma subunit